MQTPPGSDEVLDLLQEVAAEVVLPRYQHLLSGEVDQKRPGDYVTVADREAEARITAQLRAWSPGCLVVGEEATFTDPSGLGALGDAELAYTVDPVDGTANFVHGRPDFGVMVAEVRHGEPVRAWIWQPVHELAFVGERGAGVTCNGRLVPRRQGPIEQPRGVSSKRRRLGFDADGRTASTERSRFCAATDYCRVVSGDLDFVVYEHTLPWDHTPGALLLRETGGESLTFDCLPYRPADGKVGLVGAATPEVGRLIVDTWQGP